MFSGSMVALVTPFDSQGKFAEETYRRLIEFQIENGTDVIVPCGTTGESATLDFAEHEYVIKVCLDQVRKRVPVIAGTGANNTAEAIHLSENAKAMGADGLLLVCPYYNKPSQEGVYQHYKTIAETVALPQVLYNVPGRTGTNMTAETTVRLAEFDNIVAIKEAVADMERVRAFREAGVIVYSGDDPSALRAIEHGASGVISVAANVVPERIAELCRLGLAGDFGRAHALNRSLESLYAFLSVEPNPIPVKWLLAEAARIDTGIRLPLVPLASHLHEAGNALLRSLHADTVPPE